MVAGVGTGEHPPSSLEGVEQPSEASGGEKLELYLLLRLTSRSGGPTESCKNSNTQSVTLQGAEVLWGGSNSMGHHQNANRESTVTLPHALFQVFFNKELVKRPPWSFLPYLSIETIMLETHFWACMKCLSDILSQS